MCDVLVCLSGMARCRAGPDDCIVCYYLRDYRMCLYDYIFICIYVYRVGPNARWGLMIDKFVYQVGLDVGRGQCSKRRTMARAKARHGVRRGSAVTKSLITLLLGVARGKA